MIDSDVDVNDPEVDMIRNKEGDNLIDEIVTDLEKSQILNSKYQSLEKMVELVHCGTRDDF